MRISDWSSDVCSSDLTKPLLCTSLKPKARPLGPGFIEPFDLLISHARSVSGRHGLQASMRRSRPQWFAAPPRGCPTAGATRSEEHTSELQSLMRISYAVFCLKKQTSNTHINKHNNA